MFIVQYNLNGIWVDFDRRRRGERKCRAIATAAGVLGVRCRVISRCHTGQQHRPGYAESNARLYASIEAKEAANV